MNVWRTSIRMIARAPWFSAVSMACIAIGVGTVLSLLGVVYAALYQPPPRVAEPQSLVRIDVTLAGDGLSSIVPRLSSGTSYPIYRALRNASADYADFAAYYELSVVAGDETRQPMQVAAVTSTFFEVLRTAPLSGQLFRPASNDIDASERDAVLSYEYFRSVHGGDRTVIGRDLLMDNVRFRVIGVTQPGFAGLEMEAPDAWILLPAAQQAGLLRVGLYSPVANWLQVFARLRPPTTALRLSDHLQRISSDISTAFMGRRDAISARARATYIRQNKTDAEESPYLWSLGLAVTVLIVASSNVGGLLVARALERRREFALRAAVGATPSALVTQVAAECAVLTFAGSVIGISLVGGVQRLALAASFPHLPALVTPAAAGGVMLVAMAVVFAASVMPVWRGFRDGTSAFRAEAGGGAILPGRSSEVAVGGQIALAVVLLSVAAIFRESLRRAEGADLGFRGDSILVVSIRPSAQHSTSIEDVALAFREFPGVLDVAVAQHPPFVAMGFIEIRDQTQAGDSAFLVFSDSVDANYFRTMGTVLVEGRYPTNGSATEGSDGGTVITEPLARRLWPGKSAVGDCVPVADQATRCVRVAGVIRGVRLYDLNQPPSEAVFFVRRTGTSLLGGGLVVRVSAPPQELLGRVAKHLEMRGIPNGTVSLLPITGAIMRQTGPMRLRAALLLGFSACTLALALVGLAGVAMASVAQRSREFGIRMALGANAYSIISRQVIARGLTVTALGSLVGVVISLVVFRMIDHTLADVAPPSAAVILAIILVLPLAAVAAMLPPAFRAASVDPAVALRME